MLVGPDLPIAHSLILYNGAELDVGAFRLVEYAVPDSAQRIDALILIRRPQLTELEHAILAQVPGEVSEINLSDSLSAYTGAITKVVARSAELVLEWAVEKALDAAWDYAEAAARDAWHNAQDAYYATQGYANATRGATQYQANLQDQQFQEVQVVEQEQADEQEQAVEQEEVEAEGGVGAFREVLAERAALLEAMEPTAAARTLLMLRSRYYGGVHP